MKVHHFESTRKFKQFLGARDGLFKAPKIIINITIFIEKTMESQDDEIEAQKIGVVARSKKEAYTTLTIVGDYYLPEIDKTRADFVADLMSGPKRVS